MDGETPPKEEKQEELSLNGVNRQVGWCQDDHHSVSSRRTGAGNSDDRHCDALSGPLGRDDGTRNVLHETQRNAPTRPPTWRTHRPTHPHTHHAVQRTGRSVCREAAQTRASPLRDTGRLTMFEGQVDEDGRRRYVVAVSDGIDPEASRRGHAIKVHDC